MNRGDFADLVTDCLSQDVGLMDSVVGMSWDSKGENLLIRMEPINQEAWREIAQIAVDRLRDLAARALFKAKVQMLSVHGAKNLVFALQPIKAENQNQPQ